MSQTNSRREYQAAWYRANRERILDERRRYYDENRDRVLERIRRHRAAQGDLYREKRREWDQRYAELHSEGRRAQQRTYWLRRGYLLHLNRWVAQKMRELERGHLTER